MAHFALTDASERRFHAFERFSRASLGLAGASAEPLEVWLEDWRLESTNPATAFPASLEVSQDEVGIRLELEPGKPIVLQGDRGLSAKGAQPGNASYYYSFTRLPTRGVVRLGEAEIDVEGESWMDREWSTSALEEGQVGWDWFALQLGDGRELMVYRMRREGGLTDPTSSGMIVDVDGASRFLGVEDFEITATATWRSDQTGIDYPGGWRVTSPTADIDLSVEPLLARQEHTSSVLYWEGAVTVRGTSLGKTIEGRGYVELTGYDTAEQR
jgi:predicted secreted hydrolase